MINFKRGQVSTEYLAIIMFFLLVSVPIFTYFYIAGPEKEYYVSVTQAEQVANEIIDNSRLVSTNLYGTKISRTSVIPKYTKNITFSDNTVVITLENNDLKSQVVRQGAVRFNETYIEVYGGTSYTLMYENTNQGVHVSAPVYEVGG
jgi:uncharacterized protein (UPF0333 family)